MVGCAVVVVIKNDNVNSQIENNHFQFLREGNSWTYIVYDVDDVIYDVDDDFEDMDTTEGTITLKHNTDTILGNTKYSLFSIDERIYEDEEKEMVMLMFGAMFKFVDNLFKLVDYTDAKGIVFGVGATSDSETPRPVIFLLENYPVGKKWFSKDFGNYDDDYSIEIISTDETLTVAAGTFENCVKISIEHEDDKIFWWIRNDIGVIKTETEENIMELKSKNF